MAVRGGFTQIISQRMRLQTAVGGSAIQFKRLAMKHAIRKSKYCLPTCILTKKNFYYNLLQDDRKLRPLTKIRACSKYLSQEIVVLFRFFFDTKFKGVV